MMNRKHARPQKANPRRKLNVMPSACEVTEFIGIGSTYSSTFTSKLHSFGSQFHRLKPFPVYAFFLAADTDKNVLPWLARSLFSLHKLTGDTMLIVAPHVELVYPDGRPFTDEQIALAFSELQLPEELKKQKSTLEKMIKRFISDNTAQTTEFADFIGLPMRHLPCITFFSSITNPRHYLYWTLKKVPQDEIVDDFRRVVDALKEKLKGDPDADLLATIKTQKYLKIGRKLLKWFAKKAPDYAKDFLHLPGKKSGEDE